jgi:hypothetical protein
MVVQREKCARIAAALRPTALDSATRTPEALSQSPRAIPISEVIPTRSSKQPITTQISVPASTEPPIYFNEMHVDNDSGRGAHQTSSTAPSVKDLWAASILPTDSRSQPQQRRPVQTLAEVLATGKGTPNEVSSRPTVKSKPQDTVPTHTDNNTGPLKKIVAAAVPGKLGGLVGPWGSIPGDIPPPQAGQPRERRKSTSAVPSEISSSNRQRATKFEVTFDEEDAVLKARKEAKMEALRRRSELAPRIQAEQGRSASAGVFRRRGLGGAPDSMEERSVGSVRRMDDDHSEAGQSTASRASKVKPSVVRSPEEKGYLYYHDQTRGRAGKIDIEPPPALEESHQEAIDVSMMELSRPAVPRPDSPGASVAPSVSSHRRQRAASAGRQTGARLSNLQQVRNALTHVCLAGVNLEATRGEALLAMDLAAGRGSGPAEESVGATQFVVMLYHSKTLAFRALYLVHPDSGIQL